MSVYYKGLNGQIKKMAGHLTQRVNSRWFKCTRVLENGQEYYVVPDNETENYFNTISPFTIYNFGFEQPNTTTSPKLRYKQLEFDIRDLSNKVDQSVGIGQMQGVFSMFTQELENADRDIYFIGDLHKDYGVIDASATIQDGDPDEPAEVNVTVVQTLRGYELQFDFSNMKGHTGPQGPRGIQGIQGIQGETGPQALAYGNVIGQKYNDNDIINLDPTAFNRTPVVGDSLYVIAAERYFTLLVIQTVTTLAVTAKVINSADLQGPQGPQGPSGVNPNLVIETIEVNGVPQPVNNKTVNLAIPTTVSDLTNDLNFATQSFVNSSIAANAARFITPTATGTTSWSSFNDLTSASAYYNAGQQVTLSNNDYAVFLKTVSGTTEQWRAVYQEIGGQGQWMEQYKIGSAFTAAQQAAVDSGITAALVSQIGTNASNIVTINNTFNSYLPLAGGTMSGAVNFSNTDFIKANNAQATLSRVLSYSNTSNNILLGSSGWSNIEISNNLLPDTDNIIDIGSSTKYFKDAYIKGDIRTNGDIYANGNKLELPNTPGTVALVSNITTAIASVDLDITALQNSKADASNVYTKTEINNLLNNKANMTDTNQTITTGGLTVNGNSITINGATITYNSTTQTWEI